MRIRYLAPAVLALIGAQQAALAQTAPATGGPVFCIFDILGTTGEGYSAAKDYAAAMLKTTGANLTLKVYTDERVAVEDFRTGQCDAVSATAMRTRLFNSLTASIDAIGATTVVKDGKVDMKASFSLTKKVIETFANPQAAKMMVNGPYEIAGIIPLGPAYPIVNDRKINSVEAAAGKRIAAFDHDKAQATLIHRVGAQAVSADVTNFATKFNNGLVDIIIAPTIVYQPLELHKGIGKKGAVARMPLVMLSYQMVIKSDKFPAGYGQKSREYWLSEFEHAQGVIERAEKTVPAPVWMELTAADTSRYAAMMRDARIEVAQMGIYDKRGLKIIKRIRCAAAPQEPECADSNEIEWKP